MKNDKRNFKKQITIYKREVGSTKFEIPITMVFDGSSVTYYAEYYGKFKIEKKGKSLKEIYDYLDSKIMDTAAIKWEPFIEIKFEGRAFTYDRDEKKSYHGDQRMNYMKMELGTDLIEIGTDLDGNQWTRTQNSDRDWIAPYSKEDGFQKQRWAGSKLSGSPRPEHDDEILITTIPDTPENREALRLLIDKFERLRIALFDIMIPDTIQKTLTQALSGSHLLTEMAGDSADKK